MSKEQFGEKILGKINLQTIIEKISIAGEHSLAKAHLLTTEEIYDYAHECIDLFARLLSKGKLDPEDETYNAMKTLMTSVNAKIQMRGGTTEMFLQLMHFIQFTFMDEITNQQQNETQKELLFLLKFSNNLVMDTFRIYQEEREEALAAQKEEFLAVSAPITEIWEGVLSLPVIGTLDSSRAMDLMEKLLETIELRRSKVVILDLTGVSTIDTQVMHHLIQVIRSTALMGAKAILTGIRPSIAKSLANLNLNLDEMHTKSTLSEGLKEAFAVIGVSVS